MKSFLLLFAILLSINLNLGAQESEVDDHHDDELPYHEISNTPNSFEANNIIARTIDGLGFRYHWATEDLRPQDLLFTPGNDGRNCGETLQHIYDLSGTILNAAKNGVNIRPLPEYELDWEEMRAKTLENFKEASDMFRALDPSKLEDLKIIFERDGKQKEFPLWHLLNGPMADAIYHTGQIVSFRRSAGNPQPSGVNVFSGKKHEH